MEKARKLTEQKHDIQIKVIIKAVLHINLSRHWDIRICVVTLNLVPEFVHFGSWIS